MSEHPSILWMNNFLFCRYLTFCFSSHHLMGIWVASTFGYFEQWCYERAPLQYSCLENPMDGGAWWAVVYGVAKSRTRLKWLSSSSSSYERGCVLALVWVQFSVLLGFHLGVELLGCLIFWEIMKLHHLFLHTWYLWCLPKPVRREF